MYIDILRRLRDAVRGKRAEELRTNNSFLLHDNSSTQVSFGRGFLSKEQCDNTGASSSFFYLFPRLKSALNGRHFCGAPDIIKNVTE